ncbi:MAG: proline dehydrogenase / delta 1-pyrroline-5-carboxylate dehydrogenase, partial [Halothiobacillaceae bacterium]
MAATDHHDSALPLLELPKVRSPLRRAIQQNYLADEAPLVASLANLAQHNSTLQQRIALRAYRLVEQVRATKESQGGLDAFLREYNLSSDEGIVLMCLAEALLRIPDDATADKLIHAKLSAADWQRHFDHSDSLLVNASTWGLMLTGRLINLKKEIRHDLRGWFNGFVARSGEPLLRLAMRHAMGILGRQFVMGETIESAVKRSQSSANARYRYSFDMLGEAALTAQDAGHYFAAYRHAIATLATMTIPHQPPFAAPNISIKLSALHPRYHLWQRTR